MQTNGFEDQFEQEYMAEMKKKTGRHRAFSLEKSDNFSSMQRKAKQFMEEEGVSSKDQWNYSKIQLDIDEDVNEMAQKYEKGSAMLYNLKMITDFDNLSKMQLEDLGLHNFILFMNKTASDLHIRDT